VPVGFLTTCSQRLAAISSAETEALQRSAPFFVLVDQAHPDAFAFDRRSTATRMSSIRLPPWRSTRYAHPGALRRSAMSELGQHLEARRDTRGHAPRNTLDLLQHTVDSVADDERGSLLGHEVDVARPVFGTWKMIAFTSRTSGASEMPSSASRSSDLRSSSTTSTSSSAAD